MKKTKASISASRFILHLLEDFSLYFIRSTPEKREGFAFIVHPRDFGDIYRTTSFFNLLPKTTVEWILTWLWPVTVAEINGLKNQNGEEVIGWIIACPLTARQMMENREIASRRVYQAALLAERRGAKNIGLGGLTGSVTRGGLDLVDKIKAGITTGRAYTAFNVSEYLFDVLREYRYDPKEVKVAVVGAAGGVGSSSAILLASLGIRHLILIDLDRKLHLLDPVKKELTRFTDVNIETSSQIRDVRNADIIITATNAPEAVIRSDDLRPGAIVIDDAQPSDIAPEVFKKRRDVIIIEAGVIETHGINYNFNFHLAARDHTYACLAEIMALSYLGWEDHYSIGGVEISKIYQIAEVAKKLGFKLAPWQNFSKFIEESQKKLVGEINTKQNSSDTK